MDSSSSNRPRSASSFESNTHFNIESIRRDPDSRSLLNSVLYVKSAFHKLLRTKSKVGCILLEESERPFRTKGADVSLVKPVRTENSILGMKSLFSDGEAPISPSN